MLIFPLTSPVQPFNQKTKRLSWVDRVQDRPDLLQGVGVSQDTGDPEKDQQRADSDAISQIINEISTTVESKLMDYYEESSSGGIVSSTGKYSYMSSHYAKETIKGIKITERYYDNKKKLYYSYALLYRSDLEKQFHEKAENAVKLCADYHRYAQQSLTDRNIYAALMNYGKALGELFIAQAFLKKKIEGKLEADGRDEMIQARLESEASTILGKLFFQQISGMGQKAQRNRGLNKPLVGKVTYQDSESSFPLANIPVSVRFVNAKGELTGKVQTTNEGIFTGYVSLIESAEAEIGLIKATLSLPELEPFRRQIPGLYTRLDEIGVTFNFIIDVAASVRIFVRIFEEADGAPVRKSYSSGGLIKSLVQNKFSVIDVSGLSSKTSPYDLDMAIQYGNDQGVISAVGKDADYAIVGSIISETGDKAVGSGIVFARADADIRVVDIQSGRVITSSAQSRIKGAGNSSTKAHKAAIKKCGNLIVPEIVEGLKNTLK